MDTNEQTRRALKRDTTNYDAATKEMGLTPQEQYLYIHHLNNIWNGSTVKNEDGSTSSAYTAGIGISDKQYNIPTVWHGKIVDIPEAHKNAEAVGMDKWPSYGSPEEAYSRYNKMHDYMEKDIVEPKGQQSLTPETADKSGASVIR